MADSRTESVQQHYETPEGNAERITRILEALDQSHDSTTTKQLSPLDHFHIKGFTGTKELAELAGIEPWMKVLDAGSGLGGPSRYLAETYGCSVTGVDLTPSYVELATILTQRTGLADRVTYQVGDLLALPFPDSHFDLVWTQHVVMNIQNRDRLYQEFRRVLKLGGKLAFHDLFTPDDKPELTFPLPWAETNANSFLFTKAETIAALNRAGFKKGEWKDDTEESLLALAAQSAAIAGASQGLSLASIVGPRMANMAANVGRNAREGKLRAVMGIYQASS